ncbi:E3 ubiquitin/ISG15 ligase TRIM25-like, partial [Clarias magur]
EPVEWIMILSDDFVERKKHQKQLLEIQKKSKQAIQDREKELQKLKKAVETHKHSAQTAMQEIVKMFSELIKAIEKRQHEVAQLIRDEEKAAVSRAQDVIKQLQQEIGELKKRDFELEKLSRTEDPIQYLQSFQSVPAAPGSANFTSITYRIPLTFEKVLKSVSQLRDKLETFFNSEFKDISPGAQTSGDADDCVIIWEKKPTMKEERKAMSLHLPPTFFCGTSSDSDTESDSLEDFETELQKVQQALVEVKSGEKDEGILFKHWAKLSRWDRDLDQWKKQLLEIQRKYQHKIQKREKELHDLTKAVESHKRSAQSAVQQSQKIFTDLIKSIERRCSEVTAQIRAQEKAAVSPAEEVMKQLEQEITELKRRTAEMEELSHTQDPIYFLQNFQAVLAPMGCDIPTITVHSLLSFENVIVSVSQLKSALEDLCKDQIKKISSEVKKVRLISPQSREELLE